MFAVLKIVFFFDLISLIFTILYNLAFSVIRLYNMIKLKCLCCMALLFPFVFLCFGW